MYFLVNHDGYFIRFHFCNSLTPEQEIIPNLWASTEMWGKTLMCFWSATLEKYEYIFPCTTRVVPGNAVGSLLLAWEATSTFLEMKQNSKIWIQRFSALKCLDTLVPLDKKKKKKGLKRLLMLVGWGFTTRLSRHSSTKNGFSEARGF